jgi:hypothetical protein
MDVGKLDEEALRHELTIRKMMVDTASKARADLRQRLKDEKVDPSLCPTNITEEVDQEVKEVAEYFERMVVQYTKLKNFSVDRQLRDAVYSKLCHVEGRWARIHRETIEDINNRTVFDVFEAQLIETRETFFGDRVPYIVVRRTDTDRQDSFNTSEQTDELTAEEKKELEEMKKRTDELMNKRAKARRHQVSDTHEVEEPTEEEIEEAKEEEEREKQRKIDEQIRQSARGSGSGVIPGSHPPGQFSSGQNFSPLNPDPLFPSQSNPLSSANGNVAGVQSSQLPLNSTMFSQTRPAKIPAFPPHKWSIKFSGETDGSVITFIKDAENMAISQNLDGAVLGSQISCLLKGKAADWYRAFGNRYVTWNQMVAALKDEYLPEDYDNKVDNDIISTKQREDETFHDFCVKMELLFMRRSVVLSESQKLSRLKINMRKEYKYPGVKEMKSIDELKKANHYLDSIDERFNKQHKAAPKPLQRVCEVQVEQTQAEDSSKQDEAFVNDIERLEQQVAALSQQFNNMNGRFRSDDNITCYCCDKKGHRAMQCPQKPSGVFCFRCMKPGVYSNTPHDCRKQNNITTRVFNNSNNTNSTQNNTAQNGASWRNPNQSGNSNGGH